MKGQGKWSSLEIKLLWRIGELSIFLSHYVILCSLLPLGPLICLRSLYKCAKIQIAALLHSFFCYQKHIFVCLCEGGNFTKQHPSQHKCHYFSKPIWNVDKIPPNSRALLMKWEICPVSWDLPPRRLHRPLTVWFRWCVFKLWGDSSSDGRGRYVSFAHTRTQSSLPNW